MSGFLDTSIVVRYLTGDPPNMAEQAARVIDGEEGLQITDVVLAETAYVLTSVYRISRSGAVDHLVAFLQKQNISTFVLDKGLTPCFRPCSCAGRRAGCPSPTPCSGRRHGLQKQK